MLALILAVIVAVGAAMGGVVAVSDSAAPGDALYGIDRTVEKARVGLAGSPEARTQLLRAQAEERLQETGDVVDGGGDVNDALEEYFAAVDALLEAMLESGEIDAAELEQILAALAAYEDQIDEILASIQDDGAEDDPAVDDDLEDKEEDDLEDQDDEDDLEDDEEDDLDDEEDDQDNEDDEDFASCVGADPHPVGMRLAEAYGLEYEVVMGWFCDGYGMGEIMHALSTAEGDGVEYEPEEILAMKDEVGGWGRVWQELGLIGNGRRNPNRDVDGYDDDPQAEDDVDETDDEIDDVDDVDEQDDLDDAGPGFIPPGQSGDRPGNGPPDHANGRGNNGNNGNNGNARGNSGNAPGNSGNAPGNSGNARGNNGNNGRGNNK